MVGHDRGLYLIILTSTFPYLHDLPLHIQFELPINK